MISLSILSYLYLSLLFVQLLSRLPSQTAQRTSGRSATVAQRGAGSLVAS